jgi:hypothetical protein
MPELKAPYVYQLKVWLLGISPMVWRRLLVRSDSTIADLHYTLQIAVGWSDTHLNRFHIHGKDFGVYHIGGMGFADNPEHIYLSGFGFRIRERFLYEYDFGDAWLHEVRIEKLLPLDPQRTYPVCIGGQHAAPRKTAAVRWLICGCGKNSSTGHCSVVTGGITTSTTRTRGRLKGHQKIDRLTRMTSPVARSMPAYGNMQEVTAIGCF